MRPKEDGDRRMEDANVEVEYSKDCRFWFKVSSK